MTHEFNGLDIVVLIPCYNEEVAVPLVVRDFRLALPNARIFVYDNASTDRTAEVARAAGARVGHEPFPGKGNVMRRMFSDIEADVYVLVDGDDTYDASAAPKLVRALLDNQLDMVNGARVTSIQEAYRFGHRLGNQLLTGLVQVIFGKQFDDMLSGYRVFSRRFVKSFPAISSGFEIETELTVHALELRMKTAEVPIRYKDRPEGSASKLNTIRDGLRPENDWRAGERRAAADVLWQYVRRADAAIAGPGFSSGAGVFANRPGTATSDRRTGRGHHACRIFVDGLRPDPRHRDALSARAQATRLPGNSGSRLASRAR